MAIEGNKQFNKQDNAQKGQAGERWAQGHSWSG